MVKNIRHTGIVVTDMDRALRFYRELLGLGKVVADSVVQSEFLDRITGVEGARIRIVMVQAPDGSCLELLQYLSNPKSAPDRVESCDIGCSHISLSVDEIGHVYEKLSANGVQFNSPPEVDPEGYAKVTYCHDFDGTIVELVQVIDEKKTPYKD